MVVQCQRHLLTTPLRHLPFTVLDFETTGLNSANDAVVQISAVQFDNAFRPQVVLNRLINPGRPIDPRATNVHGITDADVANAPRFQDVQSQLLGALNGRVLVGYNAAFDLRFLRSELRRVGLDFNTAHVCAMEFRQVLFSCRRCRLMEACAEAGINLKHAHDAASDALATAHLLSAYIDLAIRYGAGTITELAKCGSASFLRSFTRPVFEVFPSAVVSRGDTGSALDALQLECQDRNTRITESIEKLDSLLKVGVEQSKPINWNALKRPTAYSETPPARPKLQPPEKPDSHLRPDLAKKPQRNDERYDVKDSIAVTVIPGLYDKRVREADEQFRRDCEHFTGQVNRWNALVRDYNKALEKAKSELQSELELYESKLLEYKKRQSDYLQEAARHNASIDELERRYNLGDSESVQAAVQEAFRCSVLPENIGNTVDVSYHSGVLQIVRQLPDFEEMPSVKEVKVVKKDSCIREVPLSDAARKRIFDTVVYQLMLRSAHEAFASDRAGHATAVEVMGVVDGFNPATGHPARLVLAKLSVERTTMSALRLENVEPAVCFKELKGKTKVRPSNLQPVGVLEL